MIRPYIETAALLTHVSMRPNSATAAAAMRYLFGVRDIGNDMNCAATVTSNALDGPLEVVTVPCRDNQPRAGLRCVLCGDETDTARRAGNDDDLFVERQERNLHGCLRERPFEFTSTRTRPDR
jgi:hypothetical protein